MAVGVDRFLEKRFGGLPDLRQPVARNQCPGVGVGVREGEHAAPQLFHVLVGALFRDDQVGLVKGFPAHLRGRQGLEPVFFAGGRVGAGADEGQVDLALEEKRVDLIVGFALDELNAEPRIPADVVEELLIVYKGLFGRYHRRDRHAQHLVLGGVGVRVRDGNGF